ncbi:DUF262 domain-containing protein [Dactylosporangium vinaceum]|nr:DUF262 domain-containing protein [Dactylosporangium vinaceum]UAB95562.1 DUF262 domain-containing protein [Dactylosporangium vinaceum]
MAAKLRRSYGARPLVSAKGIKIREFFDGRSFDLGHFQRSYVWEQPQVERLVRDLAEKFRPQWDEAQREDEAEEYEPYFLGSVITYSENGQTYLADGQQRVITLLLLLIHLYRLTDQREDVQDLSAVLRRLIRGENGMARRFAVRAGDFHTCFDHLLNDQPFSQDGRNADVLRVWNASQHIAACCPPDLQEDALPHFTRWLLERVSVVEIEAGDADRGKELFVLMNDRGVRLAPLDHLKNYLLTDAPSDPIELDRRWQGMVNTLQAIDRNAPMDFVRTILRARYFDAGLDETTGEAERARDAAPHEWLHDHTEDIWQSTKKGVQARLFTEWLEPRYGAYAELQRATTELHEGLEPLWYNAFNRLPQQFDLTFAAVQFKDTEAAVLRKAKLVANFIDLFVVTRGLSEQPHAQSDLDEELAPLLPAARESRTEEALSRLLGEAAVGWYKAFANVDSLRYREGVNRPFVLYFLARLTAWVERRTGRGEPVQQLLDRADGQRPYEIEHLFTKRTGAYAGEPEASAEFKKLRGRLGGLILLDGPENASLGGLLLVDKVEVYPRYNWLAASLHPDSYRGRGVVRFKNFLTEHGLADRFRAYDPAESIDQFIGHRNALYQELARRVWAPEALGLTMPAAPSPAPSARTGPKRRVSLADLLRAGLIRPEEALIGRRKGREHRATLLADGRIRTASGGSFSAPTRAAMDARDVPSEDGWRFWTIERTGESLAAVRARYSAAR